MKKFFTLLMALTFVICTYAFATEVVVSPDNPDATLETFVSNDTILAETTSDVYDMNEKFTYTFPDGTYIECPKYVSTQEGMITTKDWDVYNANTLYNSRFSFKYTGLKTKKTSFYIVAYNANGQMMDVEKVDAYNDVKVEYKKNGKVKYKYSTITEGYDYWAPEGATKVIVTGTWE